MSQFNSSSLIKCSVLLNDVLIYLPEHSKFKSISQTILAFLGYWPAQPVSAVAMVCFGNGFTSGH